MASIGITMAKWILILINFVAIVLGIAVIAVGGVSAANMPFDEGNAAAVVFILSGICILVFSMIGVVGALREAPRLLLAYCIATGIATVVIFAICVSAFTTGGMAKQTSEYVWQQASNSSRTTYETHFECCGWDIQPPVDKCSIGDKAKGPCEPIFVAQMQKAYVGIAVTALILTITLVAAIILAALIRASSLKSTTQIHVA